MRTLRLADPFPRGQPPQKLEWGSSAWAADSCLVEWSRFEREWLEPQPKPSAPAWGWRDIPLRTWLALLGFAALVLAAFALI